MIIYIGFDSNIIIDATKLINGSAKQLSTIIFTERSYSVYLDLLFESFHNLFLRVSKRPTMGHHLKF
jgi:hypothetical protein